MSTFGSKRPSLFLLAGMGTLLWFLQDDEDKSFFPKAEAESKRNATPPALINELQQLLGMRCVTDSGLLSTHGKDFSFNQGVSPDVLVYPLSASEVQEIVKICNKYKVPIIPYGGGTSLEGHITATRGGVCISFEQMKAVITVNESDMYATVQPGITYDELNDYLAKFNLFFPMDPGPGASIGGMVGTSCSGTNAVRYGTMKENVLSLNVVLPNGDLVKTRQFSKKSSAGYDLTHLFIGSEGTLGITTQVTVKLQRIPEAKGTKYSSKLTKKAVAVCQFKSIEDACDSVIELIQKGIQIGKVELLDDVMIKAVNMSTGLSWEETPSLFFEFSGSKKQVEDQQDIVDRITRNHRGGKLHFATNKDERDELWLARKTALWAAPSLKPGSETKITDVCVPVSRIAECIRETKADLRGSFLFAPLVGHVGDGNFHLFILLNPKDPKDVEEAHRIDSKLIHRAIEMGGTCTGEHGVGVGKRNYLLLELGPEAVNLMKTIKKAIDPNNIMNPGKIMPDDSTVAEFVKEHKTHH